MSRSSQSSRSTSSYSSGKIPLSCQSGSKQQATYNSYGSSYPEPRYATTLSEPRSGSSSASSSSKSGRPYKSDKIPLSISHSSSSSREDPRPKETDDRYYKSSFLDSSKPQKKPLSCQKELDERYYANSSYYR